MAGKLHVAFWNVQNLFKPGVVDRGPQTQEELEAKLSVVSNEVNHFFGGTGPDLVGIAEVHDLDVFNALADLLDDTYLRLWVAAPQINQTGLGVLARGGRFDDLTLVNSFQPSVAARPRSVIAMCKAAGASASFLFVVNHWKSRLGDLEITNADRVETANWIGDHLSTSPVECALVMGDFNAEPFEPPFNDRIKGRRNFRGAFVHGTTEFLYNTAWKFLAEPDSWQDFDTDDYQQTRPTASHDASTVNLLDHLLVSKRALKDGTLTMQETTVEFVCNDVTSRRTTHGVLRPKRWNYVAPGEHEGSSDHFPLLASFDIS